MRATLQHLLRRTAWCKEVDAMELQRVEGVAELDHEYRHDAPKTGC